MEPKCWNPLRCAMPGDSAASADRSWSEISITPNKLLFNREKTKGKMMQAFDQDQVDMGLRETIGRDSRTRTSAPV